MVVAVSSEPCQLAQSHLMHAYRNVKKKRNRGGCKQLSLKNARPSSTRPLARQRSSTRYATDTHLVTSLPACAPDSLIYQDHNTAPMRPVCFGPSYSGYGRWVGSTALRSPHQTSMSTRACALTLPSPRPLAALALSLALATLNKQLY